jgi:hypothetical protein
LKKQKEMKELVKPKLVKQEEWELINLFIGQQMVLVYLGLNSLT